MAKSILRDQKIWFDGYDLTGNMNSVALEYAAEAVEATAFGNNSRGNLGGLKSVSIGASGFVDLSTLDAALFDRIGVMGKGLSFGVNGTEGSPIHFLKAFAGSYNPGAAVGEAFKFELGAASEGGLVRGTLMENNSAIGTTGSGTVRQNGAVSASQELVAVLHVLNVTGTLPTLDVVIKSDATNAFSGAESTRLTFAQKNAIGSEVISAAGAITDTYHKVYWTVGGSGSPTFDFIVGLGIRG